MVLNFNYICKLFKNITDTVTSIRFLLYLYSSYLWTIFLII
jgi:hypothetical protein